MAREVKKVQSALKNVADGDLTHRITTKRRDEFGQLESSFNEMTSHISELISDVENKSKNIVDVAGDKEQYQYGYGSHT